MYTNGSGWKEKLNYKDRQKTTWVKKTYNGASGDVIAIPICADFTVTCNGGYIDYVLFSFNNGSWASTILSVNHSEHWDRIVLGTSNSKEATNYKSGRYHPLATDVGGNDRCAWWDGHDLNASSVTFCDDRTSTNTNREQTMGWLWMYVFYHKASITNPAPTITGSDFTGDECKVTLTNNVNVTNGGINNLESCPLRYTTNGVEPTTESAQYSDGIPISCTTIIKARSQVHLKLSKYNSEITNEKDHFYDGYFVDLPDYYDVQSSFSYKTITQYWPVSTLNGRHTDGKYYATFYHNHNMIVPDNCSAWTYKKITKNGLPYMAPSKEYSTTAVKVIPAYTAVIVCSNSAQSQLKFTNPVDNSSSGMEADNNQCSDFTGNSKSDAQDVSASGYTNYYLMTDGDNGGLKFMRYNGKCPSHACYLHLSSSSPLAKGFVFSFPDETTGINVISADNSVSGDNVPMYNAAGQRVGSGYKGIVIQNGRKFIRR